MPSPEVINLTLSDDEIHPDPIRSDRGPPAPNQATNRFRTSSTIPLTSGINRTRRILPVIQGTFAAIERAENYLQRVLCGDLHQHIHSQRFCHKRVREN